MKKTLLSERWLLKAPGSAEYKRVDLPNDYSVTLPRTADAPGGPANGYFNGGHGRYVKFITPPEDSAHTLLDVDGAYMCAEVFLNGDKLAFHPYGYTPFLVDLTDRLRAGETNKLAIETDDMQPSTRWYSGAGLFRDVFLWTGGEARVEPWDAFITTTQLDGDKATVSLQYKLTLDKPMALKLKLEIIGPKGKAAGKGSLSIAEGDKPRAEFVIDIPKAKLWSPDSPTLYTARLTVTAGGVVTDKDERTFGIRTLSCDAKRGLLLNGQSIKLRGGCIHHDHGVLGAAAYPAAEARKISILKDAGFNAVRTAHYPPSLALLEACDEIGMLVMDEAFDMWRNRKNFRDYHLWFEDWWQRDIRAMVLRDRNHPCVISYSIGNEIIERDGSSDGYYWSKALAAEIRKYDKTRLVTSGVCGLWNRPEPIDPPYYIEAHGLTPQRPEDSATSDRWAELTEEYMKPLDIVGYNYLYKRYEADHEKYPKRVIWGSETHALNIYESWQTVKDNPYVIGDFTWTCYDNLGEAGTGRFMWAREGFIPHIMMAEYPWRMCFQGDMDLCGFPRPQAYYRAAVWLEDAPVRLFTTHPEHYGEGFSGTDWHWYDVCESWTFDDKYLGKPVKVEAYTGADEVEFILNGKKIARVKPEKCIASVDIAYEKGELTAVAYKGRAEQSRSVLVTTGDPAKVVAEPEKAAFVADGRDLAYFDIYIVDKNGRVCDSDREISCIVDGGELLGVYSGEPANTDEYGTNRCHAFHGRALAVVRAAYPGEVTITVGSDGLHASSASAMGL